MTAYNRGQVLYRVAEMLEGRHAQFVRGGRGAEGLSKLQGRRAAVDAAIDRWVWYAGWTDKLAQPSGRGQPGRRARSSTSPSPSRPASSPSSPRSSRRCWAVSVLAPVIASGNTAVVVPRGAPAPGDHPRRGARHHRRPRRGGQPAHRRAAELGTWLADHPDVDAIDLAGARRRPGHGIRERGGRHRQARPPPTATGDGLDGRPGPLPDDGVPGDEDGLAPDRLDLFAVSPGETPPGLTALPR